MNDLETIAFAVNLLDDDLLVWSNDFEQIRSELANWLRSEVIRAYALQDEPVLQAVSIANILIKDECGIA